MSNTKTAAFMVIVLSCSCWNLLTFIRYACDVLMFKNVVQKMACTEMETKSQDHVV